MAQVTITQLPAAGPLTGTELVPIVQNGQTVQTTTGNIAAQPTQQQTFLTKNQELTLPNSRYLAVNTGLSLTDGGATSFYQIGLTGTAASLNAAGGGIIVKDSPNTVAVRSIAVSGGGLSVANADGTGGNPTLSLAGIAASISNIGSATGFLALNGTSAVVRQILGTTNQIAVANGDSTGNPTISIASNPIFTGTGSTIIPSGTTAQRPAGAPGAIRFNTDTQQLEAYSSGAWLGMSIGVGVTTFSAGTTGLLPSTPTTGPIVLSGTLNVANGGTGATTLTGYVKGSGTSAFTASATIPNTDISGLGTMSTQNASAVSISGGSITGATINNTTIGATTPAAATFTSVAMTSGTISSVPVNPTDIVNKDYADSIVSGLNYHQPVQYATTAALPAYTYNNGSSGIGATLTANANGALSLGGGSPTAGQRVLIKNEGVGNSSPYNGIYDVTNAGSGSTKWVLTRSTDYDSSGSGTNEIDAGDYVLVISGTLASTAWVQQTSLPITVGTTALVFVQFNAPVTYSAGTGLTLAGTTFSITNTGVTAATYGSASQALTLGINAQGQITSASANAIAITSGQVSGLAASATTDTTNAANITSGTLPSGRISGSYTGLTGVGTLTAGTWNASTIGIGYGGTGVTATPTNGQLLIGNGTGYSLANLTAGTNVTVTNTAGGITISATPAAGGTVTSVAMTVPSFLSVSGSPITTSGTLALTLSGTALPVTSGGSGATTLSGYLKGNGTSAFTASSTIPNTDITGLGTMSTQNAVSVAITGGSIDGTSVGATTASTVRGTTITATTQFSGPGTGLTGTAASLSIGGSAASATTATTATNIAGGSAGALAYNSGSGATTFLTLGTTNYVLTAGATAPQYVAQSTLSVGSATSATNATNTGITLDSTNSNYYITVVSASTGNLPQLVATGLTANPSTGKITGGIAGGTF